MKQPFKYSAGDGEVHVWYASLDLGAVRAKEMERTLSEEELGQAERFRFRKDRESFIAARGLLREILGSYLGEEPRRLRFCCGPHGKPALAGQSEDEKTLRFNVSNSEGFALFAMTRGREIGVDLEQISPSKLDEKVAERFFSPQEVVSLQVLPPSERPRAFFTTWTRREAYLKARGEGLSGISDAALEPTGWSLRTFIPQPGYVAALAAKGRDWRFTCSPWMME